MTKLEDILVLKTFEVKRKGQVVIATESENGLYEAPSAEDVEAVLNNGEARKLVYVRLSLNSNWQLMKPKRRKRRLKTTGYRHTRWYGKGGGKGRWKNKVEK